MKNLDELSTLLFDRLAGMILVSVNYASGFTVRFERETTDEDKPSVLHLIIRSSARFGAEENWKIILNSIPIKVRRGEVGDPALAYRLMLALGAQIQDIEFASDGTLSLSISDREVFVIPGVNATAIPPLFARV